MQEFLRVNKDTESLEPTFSGGYEQKLAKEYWTVILKIQYCNMSNYSH